jgi:hypothetical protein
MKQISLMDKYPVNELTVAKEATRFNSIDEIMTYLKGKVDEHPVATYIACFNHYEHTQTLEDKKINPTILDAQNIIFCFGKEIPNPAILAVRPRAIGVVERADDFVLTFMDAPNSKLHDVMVSWVNSVVNR